MDIKTLLKSLEDLYKDKENFELANLYYNGTLPSGIYHWLMCIRPGNVPWHYFDLSALLIRPKKKVFLARFKCFFKGHSKLIKDDLNEKLKYCERCYKFVYGH